MRLGSLILVAGAMFLALPQITWGASAITKKRVHIVTGNPSARTQLDLHPSKRKMVINVLVKTCDPKPSASRIVISKNSKCSVDKSSSIQQVSGDTMNFVVKYKEYTVARDANGKKTAKFSFDRNCANPKTHRFALKQFIDPNAVPQDLPNRDAAVKNATLRQAQIQSCGKNGAQNISVAGESDTKAILGKNLKPYHRHYNTRSLKNPQACDNLDNFKKLNFQGLAPEKDKKHKNSIEFRNGGFRIGNHSYYEFKNGANGAPGQWCRTTFQSDELKPFKGKTISRETIIAKASKENQCGINSDTKDPGTVRPYPLPELRKGKVFLRGSVTLLSDGRAFINPINKPLNKIDYNGMRQAAYKHALKAGKQGTKGFTNAFISKMKELYKKDMKDPSKINLNDLRNYDKSKGHIAMQFKEDKHGLRESVISTYDAKNKHLRSIQVKPTNVIGSKLKTKDSWCGGENCLLLNTKSDEASKYIHQLLGLGHSKTQTREKLTKINAKATCSKNGNKSLNMTGGKNVCMSCFGSTPGACKTDEVTTDDGFKTSNDPNDPIIGKADPIEAAVKARFAETKGKTQCDRAAADPFRKGERITRYTKDNDTLIAR